MAGEAEPFMYLLPIYISSFENSLLILFAYIDCIVWYFDFEFVVHSRHEYSARYITNLDVLPFYVLNLYSRFCFAGYKLLNFVKSYLPTISTIS